MLLDIGMIRGALQGDVQGDVDAVFPGLLHQAAEILQCPQCRQNALVAAFRRANRPRAADACKDLFRST